MDYISKWFYFWCINPSMIFLCFVFKDFDLAGPYTNVGTQKADSTMLTANDGSGKWKFKRHDKAVIDYIKYVNSYPQNT